MELFNQPFTGQLGDRLIEALDSADYKKLNIIVAFAKNSGVLRLIDSFDKFRKNGGVINVYVGIDLFGTSYEALTSLLIHTDSLNIIHAEKSQTFHTKIYSLQGSEKDLLIVGSHNLTGGGLWTNIESSIINEAKKSNKTGNNSVNDYIEKIRSLNNSLLEIKNKEDIDKLLDNGYVLNEVTTQVQIAKEAIKKENKKNNVLFGNGVPAKLPNITGVNKKTTRTKNTSNSRVSLSLRDNGRTIWFETRRMTGGSRNILDLSMKSLIEHGDPTGTEFDTGDINFMKGGVEFFGLNPNNTEEEKNITINFEGIDYKENTILFPVGKKANGTWRLQIKGLSSEGKITEAFREKGTEYLVGKIITFTKIKDDYYSMSVFPESEMENFIAASEILARNGATTNAKRIGIIKSD